MLLYYVQIYFLKGRRVNCLFRQSTYEKKFYKNNVGFIIFMALVYPAIMRKSCLRCEKI